MGDLETIQDIVTIDDLSAVALALKEELIKTQSVVAASLASMDERLPK